MTLGSDLPELFGQRLLEEGRGALFKLLEPLQSLWERSKRSSQSGLAVRQSPSKS